MATAKESIESKALVRGIALAAALVERGPPPVTAAAVMRDCSLTLEDLRAAGVEAFDFNPIAESMGLPDRMVDDDNPVDIRTAPEKLRPSAEAALLALGDSEHGQVFTSASPRLPSTISGMTAKGLVARGYAVHGGGGRTGVVSITAKGRDWCQAFKAQKGGAT